jgi:hypothetical protein
VADGDAAVLEVEAKKAVSDGHSLKTKMNCAVSQIRRPVSLSVNYGRNESIKSAPKRVIR